MRRRRRRARGGQLTPLIDVLFIVLFASLIQARQRVDHARAATAPVPAEEPNAAAAPIEGPDAPSAPADAAARSDAVDAAAPLPPTTDADSTADAAADSDSTADADSAYRARVRQLSTTIAAATREREIFVAEVAQSGHLVELQRWRDGAMLASRRLHHRLVRPWLDFTGPEQPQQRLCAIVAAQQQPPSDDLGQALVVIHTDAPLEDLPRAQRSGLARDAAMCFQDARGVGLLLDADQPIPWREPDVTE